MDFNLKLKKLRILRGWTQSDAAEAFGVELRTYQYWESGEKEPRNMKSVELLCESYMKYIELPYPPSILNPNKKAHWAVKMKAKNKYKADCGWLLASQRPEPRRKFTVTLHPPDKRRRDLDNAIASFKSGQDALADYWGIDDSEFVITHKFGEPLRNGKVVIT